MRHYTYSPSHYMLQMTVPGVFILLIGLYSIYLYCSGGNNPLWILVIIACIYSVWNQFVSLSNPSEIYIDEETLIFASYSRRHEYKLNQIEKFAMRPLAGGTKMYMTIGNGGLFRGRYWVRIAEFNDEKELSDFFYWLDAKVNPDSVFTTARKQGLERKRKKEK